MIQTLSIKYPQHIASILLLLLEMSFIPSNAMTHNPPSSSPRRSFTYSGADLLANRNMKTGNDSRRAKHEKPIATDIADDSLAKEDIGGPSQPEMSSFKSVGVDNMVNLFTGDFSYNIPLMDVGGYPINIFYDGGIGPEQEASWVGLGWNINPGTVSRNMRGIPDDFNGEEQLIQTQRMKPNNTWGFNMGYDMELIGVDFLEKIGQGSIGLSLGYSYNNYLGPALDFGVHGTGNITLANKANAEKAPISVGGGIAANVNSRNGLTISPHVSMTAAAFRTDQGNNLGVGMRLGTSYNSRTGIKQLQLSEQMSYNYKIVGKSGNERSSFALPLSSTTISFAKPSYIPSIRMPVTNRSYAGRFETGTGMFGVKGSLEGDVYIQKSSIENEDVTQQKPLIGYLYYQEAKNNPNAVMDFSRFNDNEVTPKTPIISIPQYSYDVFSIQGEGTGGSIRPYRNDLGYVRDNSTRSKDKSFSAGVDLGPPGHYGANFNQVKTPSYIGEWKIGNGLRNKLKFTSADKTFENVYFRNPGETSVLDEGQYDEIGGTELVRFKLGGSDANPVVQPVLERFSALNAPVGTTDVVQPSDKRKKRTQVINFLTAAEASEIGLDTKIKSYNQNIILNNQNNLQPQFIDRFGAHRKAHHISQINVTEATGRRYIYGLPVYNIKQIDYSFSVQDTHKDEDLVSFTERETKALGPQEHISPYLDATSKGKDGFVQVTETPPYAHSFLLSGLLSPDYVDVKGDGITEDDLGDAVKFNYSLIDIHKWKTPLTSADYRANFSAGLRSEAKDDKGLITYGERESWYLHSIESKTMIAMFTLENRDDAKGVTGPFGGVDPGSNAQKRLKKIDLYSKSDLKKNGLGLAKPIKTVWFDYSYTLCAGTPDNPSGGGGKLTLDGIHFTFNGKNKANKNKYVFSYSRDNVGNSPYTRNTSDRWGTYKPEGDNPTYNDGGLKPLKNAAFPYINQAYREQEKAKLHSNAAAWSLKTIVLPSGGQLEIEYESDDYAYVQNRRAAAMMQIVGLGKTENAAPSGSLYSFNGSSIVEHLYVFVKVPDVSGGVEALRKKYLDGLEQLAFKLSVNMPKGDEYIHCYATVDNTVQGFGVYSHTPNTVWIKLKAVDELSPITLSALDFLREKLPGQAFTGYDVSESTGLKQVIQMLRGMDEALASAFTDPIKYLRENGKARTINLDRSFVRLNEPFGLKYGGGHRVKSVKLKDNWKAMTGQYTSIYGQEYDYKTTEIFNGVERQISSGVASYEPSIGGEENPFQNILQIKEQLPLGAASYGAIEMPVLDAFFPAPVVGYSKVTVKSISKGTATHKSRSGIGKQITEFYTAKDFPVYYSHTPLQPGISDKTSHSQTPLGFFYNYSFDSRAISQGFLIVTNDMHGKMRSQTSYAENDEKTPINYTENFYRNTGVNGPEEFDFVYGSNGGIIKKGKMGVDIELMTDLREFSVSSISDHIQGQADNVVPLLGWLVTIWNTAANSDNIYRSVTTTKVINYHSVLDKVIVIDKGSTVSTENLLYDAETGNVVVSKTNNEFEQPIYNVSYPAYWAYSGMGLAYKNIDARFNVEFRDGKIVTGMTEAQIKDVFESGDELYITNPGSQSPFCAASQSGSGPILWALDKSKNNSSLTNTNEDFVFIDKDGKLFSRVGVSFRIVRSGKRNMLSSAIASVSTTTLPISTIGNEQKLAVTATDNVINATAVEYKEKWQTDKGNIKQYVLVENSSDACSFIEQETCEGYLEKAINPYIKGLLGNFRTHRSFVFYENRKESDPTIETNLKKNGFLNNFKLYWDFNASKNLVPDVSSTVWVWNSQVTRVNTRGLELETKDALDVYTAAQYGFHKTLPTAIANNSRYEEMFYEGFEDHSFVNSLNNASIDNCSNNKHIDLGTGSITQELAFGAHTGKYAMRVNANSTLSKQVAVKSPNNLDFPLVMPTDVTKTLADIGANTEVTFTSPTDVLSNSSNSINILGSHPRINVIMYPVDQRNELNNTRFHRYELKMDFYINVTEAKIYQFAMSKNIGHLNGVQVFQQTNTLNIKISDLNGTVFSNETVNYVVPYYYDVFLCPGIYKIEGSLTDMFLAENEGANSSGGNSFHWECMNLNSQVYKSLTTQNGCSYTKPIAGDESMLQPTFSIQPNKKMLFSAWIKQNCEANCTNKVEIDFGNGTTSGPLTPTGPIIEGWQRIEKYFQAPQGVTTATIKFVNSSNQPIYFDDIRIHPFNANMKSYVYDPINLRLTAELDANNYATFYEYDGEGTLIRAKVETKEGVKTINETRSFKQEKIVAPQQ